MFKTEYAAALSYDENLVCCGLLLKGNSWGFAIISSHSRQASSLKTLPQTFAEIELALNCPEETYLSLTGPALNFITDDLTLPPMQNKDLKKALSRITNDKSLVNSEQISRGFLTLPEDDDSSKKIRTMHTTVENFQKLINIAQNLKNGIDCISAPQATADFLIAKRPFYLGRTMEGVCLYSKVENHIRKTVFASENDLPANTFGCGETPLKSENIKDYGPLANLSANEQTLFAPTLLTAVYGLGVATNQPSCFDLPIMLKPQRNIRAKNILKFVVVLLILMSITSFWQRVNTQNKLSNSYRVSYLKKKQHLSNLKSQLAKNDISFLAIALEKYQFIKPVGLNAPNILSELSKIIPKKYYLQNLQLNGSKIICQVRTDDKSDNGTALYEALKKSRFFTEDINVHRTSTAGGYLSLQLNVNARGNKNAK